jgi:AraC-like DNA-binding protein
MDINRHDSCFKLYLPLSGRVFLDIDGERKTVEPESLYFISGWHIERQICDDYMEVVWLHFIPDSLRLQFLLSHSAAFRAMPAKKFEWARECFMQIHKVFAPFREDLKLTQQVRPNVPYHLRVKLQSVILAVISDILEEMDERIHKKGMEAMERFHRATDFMDKTFLENPSLRELAEKVFMAPNYFHKTFRETFGITPFNYMLNKRMNLARELLAFSPLTVKEIALKSGYKDEFHFSKTFKKHTGLSPKAFRNKIP